MCVVCVVRIIEGNGVSVQARACDASNWVAEHLGASSRRPRHPFPALLAGVSPGRVPVHTALRKVKPGANCGASTVYCTVSTIPGTVQTCWRQCISALSGPCAPVEPVSTAQQGRRPPHVRQLEESLWSSTCKTMGTSLCATTGMSTT